MSFASRLKHAYNAFTNQDRSPDWNLGTSYASRPDLPLSVYNMDSSIVNTLYNIISIDVAATPIRHIQLGENGRFEFERASSLNDCLEFARRTRTRADELSFRTSSTRASSTARPPWYRSIRT